MPTYEYLCNGCGHEFERVQRITDDKVKTCPKCKKRKVERLISQTSFVLKGGGWYDDLYSSPKGDSESGKDGADKGASADESDKSDKTDKGKDAKDDTKPSKKGPKDKSSKGKGGKKSKGSKAAA